MLALLIMVAGALGSALRFAIDHYATARFKPRFPWAIFMINATGSFALGLITGLSLQSSAQWHSVIGTGLCGGFTTFSTAMVDTVNLFRERRHRAALFNAFGSIVMTVALASLGIAITA